MTALQRPLRLCFQTVEGWLDRIFTPAWNPFHHFGALGFFYYWIVAVTGVYIYVFFDTSTTQAYATVEYLTRDQWYLGGVMRSLHRYASDGLVLMMVVHILREFAYDRYRGARWYTWVTGVPILWFVMASGITGYWLVWDQLAQYVAVRTTEWLDWLPIFGEPIARNFLAPSALDNRFFTLMVFLHVAVPLFLLLFLWVHLARVTRPKINPPRGLAIGTFLMLLALAFVKPAVSHAPANLATVPTTLDLDWYYLGFYPLMDLWSDRAVWGLAATVTLTLFLLPWMPPLRRAPPAVVHLDNCNGCGRCEDDCPHAAITMAPRSDGTPFDREAVVDAARCVSCGICAGACPTATPFRSASALVPGIELAHLPTRTLRDLTDAAMAGLRGNACILVFTCEHGCGVAPPDDLSLGVVRLPCTGMLPPSFIDYALSRKRADGVFITGCREGECRYRFGPRWTEARLAGTRDPRLRSRVPRDRLRCRWAAPTDRGRLMHEIRRFAKHVASLPSPAPRRLLESPAPASAGARTDGAKP